LRLIFAFSGNFERYRDLTSTDHSPAIIDVLELWRDDGFSTATRGKSLTDEDVRQFTSGSVQFVAVDVGVAPEKFGGFGHPKHSGKKT